MIFILDNNISPRFAKALSALERDVRALRDELPANTPDTNMLAHLGSKGWALVTSDMRILSRPQEAAVLREAKVTTFFVGAFFSSLQFWKQAVWIVKNWPRFESMAQTIDRGTCFIVRHNGKMNTISP